MNLVVAPVSSSVPGHSKAFWEERAQNSLECGHRKETRERRGRGRMGSYTDFPSQERSPRSNLYSSMSAAVVYSHEPVSSPSKSVLCGQHEKPDLGAATAEGRSRHNSSFYR